MTDPRIETFAALIEAGQRARLIADYDRYWDGDYDRPPAEAVYQGPHYSTKIVPGRVYTKVDFGGSGKYMIDNATGVIYGIKAYGKVHKGHRYGTLDTIEEWDWSGYYPAPNGSVVAHSLRGGRTVL